MKVQIKDLMKTFLIASLLIFNITYSQEKGLDENLLHGCWALLLEDDPSDEFLSFQTCSINENKESKITALSFDLYPDGISMFYVQNTNPIICATFIYKQMKGTWSFDSKSKQLTLKYPENHPGLEESKIAYQFTVETLLPGIFTSAIESTIINIGR